jgi:hypothetical protein
MRQEKLLHVAPLLYGLLPSMHQPSLLLLLLFAGWVACCCQAVVRAAAVLAGGLVWGCCRVAATLRAPAPDHHGAGAGTLGAGASGRLQRRVLARKQGTVSASAGRVCLQCVQSAVLAS